MSFPNTPKTNEYGKDEASLLSFLLMALFAFSSLLFFPYLSPKKDAPPWMERILKEMGA